MRFPRRRPASFKVVSDGAEAAETDRSRAAPRRGGAPGTSYYSHMVEHPFDWGACAPDGWRGTIRPVDPPGLVWVNLARAFPPSRVGSGNTALRVLAFGLDNGEVIPAEVYEWVQMRSGERWGCR